MTVLPAPATYSKSALCWSADPDWHPKMLVEGRGAQVKGDDGRWYLDMTSALGANLLGYGHLYLTRKLHQQINRGLGFTLQHPAEAEAAEKLVNLLGSHVPGWSVNDLQVRWALGGSEACDGAMMLARAVTQRKWAISCGYHGWHPTYTGLTPPAFGVVPDPYMVSAPYGDLDQLALQFQRFAPVAALIIEQPPDDPPTGYWRGVRQLCDDAGALLIIDEVVTGFRLALGGLAEWAGVRPDIACYGKALGGSGVPVGAIVAPRDYMRRFALPNPVFMSATGAGNALGMAAASATLDVWNQMHVDALWYTGLALMNGLTEAGYRIVGQGPRFLVQFESESERAFFVAGMRDRDVLCNRPWIVNIRHWERHVKHVIHAAADVKQAIAGRDLEREMAGKLPLVLFSNR